MKLRNNIKLLTKDERQMLNQTRSFEILDNMIIVKCENFNRNTIHPVNQNFSIIFNDFSKDKKRKMTITVEAINIWRNNYIDSEYTLIDIQQALNILSLLNNEYTENAVKDILKDF